MPAQRWRGGNKNGRPRGPAASPIAGPEGGVSPQQAQVVPAPPAPVSSGGGRKEGEERHADIFTKTKMCKFHLLGLCSKGSSCHFAHTRDDLNPLPDLYRTKLCKSLINTGQCNDAVCKYAHNREELRSPGIPATRSAARGPKGEKAARASRLKGPAKNARGMPASRGGGSGAPVGEMQAEESESQTGAALDQQHDDQKEVVMGVPVMTYPVLGLPGNRQTYQLVMQPQMAGPPSGGMPPYGMVMPPEKGAQMWYCFQHLPDGDGGNSSTTTKSVPYAQEPSRSSSQTGSDGSCVEPSEQSSGTPPLDHVQNIPTYPPMLGDSPATALNMQGKFFPDMLYTNGVAGVTVKNTFLEFEPVRPSGGLRTVHTASGRLDLLSEERCDEE
mmetsp:Transcript_53741/g.138443  ORF Transcript_53741/g.138443 Transcript_53741/m.138443 type:complete len:386 (-) Transcript_53741:273-1430(-)|eukprot:CAMPEP_0195100950 /NCGR_PEP_ID=MMETSP0448-20130528/64825_1 /TAXON_ID=66468 /ORGANISM="Heterocapsa triquestra, Strain CCMP 448" /LENGTH=385 /DNA_ID=CAMNT_0040136185 /DNA_START=87 /DNA_END=1244 /DNA_ORIENTATION=-